MASSFSDLPLADWLKQAVASLGFETPTPVQASTIPLLMSNKDVVVHSVTGSGKSLAFLLPLLELISQKEEPWAKNQVAAIVLSPTRELAVQLYTLLGVLIGCQPETSEEGASGHHKLRAPLLLVGGTSIAEDLHKFKTEGANILVGTPGRMEEFLLGDSSIASGPSAKGKKQKKAVSRHGVGNTKLLAVLVLDEADRLLDLGFQPTITRLLGHLPRQRRTGLFSATMSESVSQIARVGLRNAVKVVVKQAPTAAVAGKGKGKAKEEEESSLPSTLTNGFVLSPADGKLHTLLRVLSHELGSSSTAPKKAIVYFSTCAAVTYFTTLLGRYGPLSQHATLYGLHGKLSPPARTSTFTGFCAPEPGGKKHQVLLCTDLAARGLDLPDVYLVVQFDPPTDPRGFNHRVGRTARAGREGKAAVILCEGREEEYVPFLRAKKVPLTQLRYPALLDLEGAGKGKGKKAAELASELQEVLLQDRGLHDLALRALVSHVRAYAAHEAAYVFRIADMDWAKVGEGWGMVKLPKMRELEKESGRAIREDVDWDGYAYKDKQKEKARLLALEEEKAKEEKRESRKRAREEASAADDAAAAAAASALPSGSDSDGDSESARKKHKGVPQKKTTAWSKKVEAKTRKESNRSQRAAKALKKESFGIAPKGLGGAGGHSESEEEEKDWKEVLKEKNAKRRKGKPATVEGGFEGLA